MTWLAALIPERLRAGLVRLGLAAGALALAFHLGARRSRLRGELRAAERRARTMRDAMEIDHDVQTTDQGDLARRHARWLRD